MNNKFLAPLKSALVIALTFLATPAFAVAQEGSAEPGEGLTAVQTVLYFVLAPLGLFLTIVVIGYGVHRPREKRSNSGRALSEIK